MAPKRITVVDDDENIRKTFSLVLGRRYKVTVLKDPAEALARLRTLPADLIIADYRLPSFDGLELIKRLRESGYEGRAILISAHPDLVKAEDLSRWAISDLFVKPLDLEALNASIERVLEDGGGARKPAG